MVFPTRLLPKRTYKPIESDLDGHFLIRRCDHPDPDATNHTVIETLIASPTALIFDLSTSLFGVFTEQDSQLNLTKEGKPEYNQVWDGHEDVPTPKDKDFEVLEKYRWFVPISVIANQVRPVEVNNTRHTVECIIRHTPFKWNFWHFSIDWKKDGKIVDPKLGKQPKTIAHLARVIVREHATFNAPNPKGIPLEFYRTEKWVRLYVYLKRKGLRKFIRPLLFFWMARR